MKASKELQDSIPDPIYPNPYYRSGGKDVYREGATVKQSVFKSSADKAAEEEAMREAGTCLRCQGRGEVFSWAGVRKDCECVTR